MDPDRLKMALASTSATAEGEIESPRVAEVQIHLKTEDGKLFLYLPTAHETLLDWPDLLQELQNNWMQASVFGHRIPMLTW